MNPDDTTDAGEDLLADVDLNVWRVPPPAAVNRSSLLVRALAPETTRAKRPRNTWLLAAMVLLNLAIAALVVILVSRPAVERTVVVQAPAGGGSVDAQVRDLLKRLEQEQRELEKKLAEIQELRALVIELSDKVHQYEQQDARRERTVQKQRDPQPGARITVDPLQPVDPYDSIGRAPVQSSSCDEVGCVLGNYTGACCQKFRAPAPQPPPTNNPLPESLDRQSISAGVATTKGRVAACANGAKGKVRVRVHVGANGTVTSVSVEDTPDAQLGACVASVIQRTVFARTQLGGSFSYPFVF